MGLNILQDTLYIYCKSIYYICHLGSANLSSRPVRQLESGKRTGSRAAHIETGSSALDFYGSVTGTVDGRAGFSSTSPPAAVRDEIAPPPGGTRDAGNDELSRERYANPIGPDPPRSFVLAPASLAQSGLPKWIFFYFVSASLSGAVLRTSPLPLSPLPPPPNPSTRPADYHLVISIASRLMN